MNNYFKSWSQADVEAHNQRVAKGQPAQLPKVGQPPKPKKLRPRLNKLETDFREELKRRGHTIIYEQAVTLKLGFDCRYTPDLVTVTLNPVETVCWEVKGPKVWDDAMVKLRVAARIYPWLTFVLVKRDDAGAWVDVIVPAE